jgi:hypothetical protein
VRENEGYRVERVKCENNRGKSTVCSSNEMFEMGGNHGKDTFRIEM